MCAAHWFRCTVWLVIMMAVTGCTLEITPPAEPAAAPAADVAEAEVDVDVGAEAETCEGRICWELSTISEIGSIQRAVTNGTDTYLATPANLFYVSASGEDELLTRERPDNEAELVLAPGGEVYAWLIPHPDIQGVALIRVMSIDGEMLAELELDQFPFGFNVIYLGYQGRLIVTASPLDSWEGDGRYLYTFWQHVDGSYQMMNQVEYPQRQLGYLEPCGMGIVLLGENEEGEASAKRFNVFGRLSRELEGSYRNAELLDFGGEWSVLLNPAQVTFEPGASPPPEIRFVIAQNSFDNEPQGIEFPVPVHDLVVSPDRQRAAVVGEQMYFRLDLDRILAGEADYRIDSDGEPPYTTIDVREMLGDSFRIADLTFTGIESEVLGILHRTPNDDGDTPYQGSVITVRQGEMGVDYEFLIRVPTAFVPSSSAAYGNGYTVSFTEDDVVLIRRAADPSGREICN